MKTALLLTEYDDILEKVEIYSLLALCSATTRQFAVCSKAFMALEKLPNSSDEKTSIETLARNIFIRYF